MPRLPELLPFVGKILAILGPLCASRWTKSALTLAISAPKCTFAGIMSTPLPVILPQRLRGTVHLPSSKSLSARALVLAAISGGALPLHLSDCDDTRAMQAALQQGQGLIDIQAAGTAMRFATALFAARPGADVTLTGTARMRQRPIGILVDALRSLGADIRYADREGCPPLHICGRRLRGGRVTMRATVSSQYISALLLIAPSLDEGLTLELEGAIASQPYIDMTLELLTAYGARAQWQDGQTLRVEPGLSAPDRPFEIEADWSAASYWYEMVALAPDSEAAICLPRLRQPSLQGDSVVAELFRPLGVHTEWTAEGVRLTKGKRECPSGPWEVDFSQCPDLAQTLVVTAALLQVPFRFTGLASLRIKETDRIAALVAEMAKLGIALTPSSDSISYQPAAVAPPPCLAPIRTYDDHRMAMAFAPAAYRFPDLLVANAEVVSKSYPAFWRDIHSLL